MKAKNYELMLDIYKGILNPQNIKFKTEDFDTCELTFTILEDMITPYNLTDCIVRMLINEQQQDCEIVDSNKGKVSIILQQSMLKEGQNVAELQIYDALNQTRRLTTPSFNYNVSRSLMNDETVQADPNFSILQDMILEVSNANEVANNAKTVAEGALSTATEAQTKALEVMANGDYAKNQGDYAKAEGDKVANKVTLNGLTQTNFNFIENKVVPDGLVYVENNISIDKDTKSNVKLDKDFTIVFDFFAKREVGESAGTYIITQGITSSGGFSVGLTSSNYLRIGFTDGSNWYYSTSTKKVGVGKHLFKLTKSNNILKLESDVDNLQIDCSTLKIDTVNTLNIKTVSIGIEKLSIFIYNRQLAQQEIQHNFTVLNNSQSVNAIAVADKKLLLGSDEDHVEMSTGRTWREEYMSLLKQHGKEVTSTGGAITVNNCIKGRVISGEIKGNTKVYKRLKGTQDVWLEIPNTETRDTVTYEYKLDSTQCIINNTGSLYPVYEPTIKGTATGLAPTIVFTPALPTLVTGDVLDLATRTITFANATTRQLTEDEFKAYRTHRKVILMGGVEKKSSLDLPIPNDLIEVLEDGSGKYTKNLLRLTINGTESWNDGQLSTSGTYKMYKLSIVQLPLNINSNAIVDKYKFKSWIEGWYTKLDDTFVGFSGVGHGICISLPIATAPTVDALKTYLQSTGGFEMTYQLATPIVTTIDKSIMPTIQTADKINICQVESAVAPSSFKLTLPVDINGEQNAAISSLQTAVALLQQQVLTLQAFHK